LSPTPDTVLAEEERLAEAVYDRLVRPALRPEDDGKYVVVAVESGEVDADDYAATGRLLARRPGARQWLIRPGPSAALPPAWACGETCGSGASFCGAATVRERADLA